MPPKILVDVADVITAIKRSAIAIGDDDYIDLAVLRAELERLGLPAPAPAALVLPAPAHEAAMFADEPPHTDGTARMSAEPVCKHCGEQAGRRFLEPDPVDGSGNDSAFCQACGRHWRTGVDENTWRGRRAGAPGPNADGQIPTYLGVDPINVPRDARMASPDHGHMAAPAPSAAVAAGHVRPADNELPGTLEDRSAGRIGAAGLPDVEDTLD